MVQELIEKSRFLLSLISYKIIQPIEVIFKLVQAIMAHFCVFSQKCRL